MINETREAIKLAVPALNAHEIDRLQHLIESREVELHNETRDQVRKSDEYWVTKIRALQQKHDDLVRTDTMRKLATPRRKW